MVRQVVQAYRFMCFLPMCLVAARTFVTIQCDFNDLSDGYIDGQAGWKVYDRVRNPSAFSVAAGVGTTASDGDKALVVKRADTSLRCVTVNSTRWLRQQTSLIEFDFRLVVPADEPDENGTVSGASPAFMQDFSHRGISTAWPVSIISSSRRVSDRL